MTFARAWMSCAQLGTFMALLRTSNPINVALMQQPMQFPKRSSIESNIIAEVPRLVTGFQMIRQNLGSVTSEVHHPTEFRREIIIGLQRRTLL